MGDGMGDGSGDEDSRPLLKASDSSWDMPEPEPAPEPGPEARVVRPWRRFSEALGAVICQRVAAGESLMEVCRDTGMPSRQAVREWRRARPGFGARLAQAQAQGRHRAYGGRRDSYDPHVGGLICERLALGMSLRQACALEGMPGETTVYGWLRRHPDFQEDYGRARVLQAHRRFDQVWEIAEAADRDGAFLARVQIDAARWQASRLAPKRYGVKADLAETGERRAELAVDEAEDDGMMDVIITSFSPGVPDRVVRFPRGKS